MRGIGLGQSRQPGIGEYLPQYHKQADPRQMRKSPAMELRCHLGPVR
ncbi:uncharacterized protein METZ01_LOCUS450504 [marine metagenome]|uniref:Uncharacterized protein n=1 Tax=marine metagenome TaxID=408172 RepID=A0A382ZQS6_9ZZZZ